MSGFKEIAPAHVTLDPESAVAKEIAGAIMWYGPKFSPKDVPRFYDISSLTENPALFKKTIDVIVARYEAMGDKKPTHVLGFDARGFLLGTPISLALGIPFVMLRKQEKSPGILIKSTPYSKEYKEATPDTMAIRRGSIGKGDRVVLVDDLIATGGTALSGFELCHAVGASVVDFMAIIAIPFCDGIRKIREYKNGAFKDVSVFTLIDDNMIGDAQCGDPDDWPEGKSRTFAVDGDE
uniref:adenine phosphoribosyltransferase n=1 Tax=Neobodo designis TaxID=312471 RepID=A0A7S1Q2X9_NEODS|mmetsp:Transcript_28156/g.87264  ORF Transcript_28156/g.87264 Transcript_28156/m.87264 type:complete len:237 (+) Transcript_28156:210-920(+)|eukprot:CAMPEP_0174856744 /NCGR_PEP_ID=MMETSP1114-20130205/36196_1 /TAXON_ID=312471 /ORGANISM="Neobodo designis, Strain CCAP 1951/1" /LENGTH=236 /DNA_ID=CAMNT_0016091549 /DNA_START=208 /DNA_END=918 /DNA_ORIENTATION=+